jgi:hypothetical protein
MVNYLLVSKMRFALLGPAKYLEMRSLLAFSVVL